ncbi:GumC family protein [Rubinisphaera margarita]|uniref:GumC family protein n=1 Tax=Rubinisphaera margarita TaxID=2909586 RepID=UPI001EE8256E|nr:hypothetical protein [Rubinisphaera margarita]MCG6155271.1 hypothetical protein [Rubinisphaera margarita]
MQLPNQSEYVELDPVVVVRKMGATLWRRRFQALSIFIFAMALITLGLLICPRAYRSDAKLFVRVGRESLAVDPTATTGQTVQLHQTRESEIASVMDLLKTRGLFDQVADRIGVDVILGDRPFDYEEWQQRRKQPATLAQSDEGASLRKEKAIKSLIGDIEQDREKESSVITVECFADSPQLAQAILTEYVDLFQQQQFTAHRTNGSFEFFEGQTAEIREQYLAASEKLRAFREKLGTVSIYTRRDSIQTQISQLEQERLTAVTSLKASEAMLKSLRIAIDKLPERRIAESVTGLPDDATGTLRRELSMLTIREGELLARFTESHPAVIAVRRRRDEAKRVLQSTLEEPSQVTNAVNPAWQEMNVKLLYEESNAVSLRARISSLDESLVQVRTQLADLNSQESEMITLEQTVELLRQKLSNYAERTEETRIEAAMADSGISNVNVVQRPSLILKAASPKKALVLIIGFLFSGGLAVSTVLLTDNRNPGSPRVPVTDPEQTYSRQTTHSPTDDDPATRVHRATAMLNEAWY